MVKIPHLHWENSFVLVIYSSLWDYQKPLLIGILPVSYLNFILDWNCVKRHSYFRPQWMVTHLGFCFHVVQCDDKWKHPSIWDQKLKGSSLCINGKIYTCKSLIKILIFHLHWFFSQTLKYLIKHLSSSSFIYYETKI